MRNLSSKNALAKHFQLQPGQLELAICNIGKGTNSRALTTLSFIDNKYIDHMTRKIAQEIHTDDKIAQRYD